MQLPQRSIPKIAVQLLFSLMACCRGGVGFGLGLAEGRGWATRLPKRNWIRGSAKACFQRHEERNPNPIFESGFASPSGPCRALSGPLNRLNAILSLLQPLDRYRTPSAIGSAIGKALSRPISHPRTGRSSQPPRSKPLGGLNRAIVAL